MRSPFGPEDAGFLLVIDSYANSRRAVADLLRESGFAVAEARNGVEGLRLARRPG